MGAGRQQSAYCMLARRAGSKVGRQQGNRRRTHAQRGCRQQCSAPAGLSGHSASEPKSQLRSSSIRLCTSLVGSQPSRPLVMMRRATSLHSFRRACSGCSLPEEAAAARAPAAWPGGVGLLKGAPPALAARTSRGCGALFIRPAAGGTLPSGAPPALPAGADRGCGALSVRHVAGGMLRGVALLPACPTGGASPCCARGALDCGARAASSAALVGCPEDSGSLAAPWLPAGPAAAAATSAGLCDTSSSRAVPRQPPDSKTRRRPGGTGRRLYSCFTASTCRVGWGWGAQRRTGVGKRDGWRTAAGREQGAETWPRTTPQEDHARRPGSATAA